MNKINKNPNNIIYWDIFHRTWHKTEEGSWDNIEEEVLKEIYVQVYVTITRGISFQIKNGLDKSRK